VERNPCEVLGVADDASFAEVRAAWRRLSKRVHPDLGGDPEAFREAFDAYELLSDPIRRAALEDQHTYSRSRSYDSDWLLDALLADVSYERWRWSPTGRVRSVLAVALCMTVLVFFLLMPAILVTH
jgi:curved DNA-binding protein CbpA